MTHRPSPQADGHPGVDVHHTVVAILCEHLGAEPHEVLPGLALVDDLGADSLDLVSIGAGLEFAFALGPIDDAQLRALRTVADVVAFVEMQRAQGHAVESITS